MTTLFVSGSALANGPKCHYSNITPKDHSDSMYAEYKEFAKTGVKYRNCFIEDENNNVSFVGKGTFHKGSGKVERRSWNRGFSSLSLELEKDINKEDGTVLFKAGEKLDFNAFNRKDTYYELELSSQPKVTLRTGWYNTHVLSNFPVFENDVRVGKFFCPGSNMFVPETESCNSRIYGK